MWTTPRTAFRCSNEVRFVNVPVVSNPYYKCKRCGSDDLSQAAELCTDASPRSDDDVRWKRCVPCGARYIVDVTQYVNIGFDGDHSTNSGHLCEPAEWDRTLALARRCPRPNDAKCTCPAHKTRPVIGESAWYWSF